MPTTEAKEPYQLEIGHLLDVCSDKLTSRGDISLRHVKRQGNRAAHFMACIPCLLNSFNCYAFPPDLLVEMVPSEFDF